MNVIEPWVLTGGTNLMGESLVYAEPFEGPTIAVDERIEVVPASLLEGAVNLTPTEIKGLRMALRFGVPDPEPDEIKSARLKLEAAEREGRS